MQILHWLFKVADHEQDQEVSASRPTTKENTKGGGAKHQDIISNKEGGRKNQTGRAKGTKSGYRYPLPFAFLCRKDVAKACFYSTLNLRTVDSCINTREKDRRRAVSVQMKKEDMGSNNKVESAAHVGNKVLPVCESALPSTAARSGDQPGALEKKEQRVKGDKTTTLSRMKELLRWAAAAKTDKGAKFIGRKVLHFRSRATLKAVPDDDQLSSDSPKISFNWEVQSCSTTSSAYSSISLASTCRNDRRKANWITTDSEFVVLEL